MMYFYGIQGLLYIFSRYFRMCWSDTRSPCLFRSKETTSAREESTPRGDPLKRRTLVERADSMRSDTKRATLGGSSKRMTLRGSSKRMTLAGSAVDLRNFAAEQEKLKQEKEAPQGTEIVSIVFLWSLMEHPGACV